MLECTSGREIADDRFVGQTFTSLQKASTVLNRVTFFFTRHVGEYLWHFWSPTDIFSRLGRVGDHDWPGLLERSVPLNGPSLRRLLCQFVNCCSGLIEQRIIYKLRSGSLQSDHDGN